MFDHATRVGAEAQGGQDARCVPCLAARARAFTIAVVHDCRIPGRVLINRVNKPRISTSAPSFHEYHALGLRYKTSMEKWREAQSCLARLSVYCRMHKPSTYRFVDNRIPMSTVRMWLRPLLWAMAYLCRNV